MFRLFQMLFDHDVPDDSAYPEHLVEMAIERVVEGTDPRLRLVPGYAKKLRPAVVKGIDQVVALVANLPPPVELSRAYYGADPRLAAFFASAEHMRERLRDDTSLAEFLASPGARDLDQVFALLFVERRERNSLGMELNGELLQREVPQVTVSFVGHRLLDPSPSEEGLRKHLRHRAFNHLVSLALRRIAAQQEARADLQRERTLWQRKLEALEQGRWGFVEGPGGAPMSPAAVEKMLVQIGVEMEALGINAEVLEHNLNLVEELLEQATSQLYVVHQELILDRMGVKRERLEGNALALALLELHSASGQTVAALPVCIPRDELPAPKDLLAEAQRLLG